MRKAGLSPNKYDQTMKVRMAAISVPVLKVFEPKLASHAIMVANHFASCPGMHLGFHPAVRKEGV